ncbi:MAG: hypothetical protein A2Z25_13835 [Planctomycetes bacterium RBG_16_55_9]|nr:MAG: hypothetical protein A2Z25_13835 [Planctomycetes bacterium RBG_16_55_9]
MPQRPKPRVFFLDDESSVRDVVKETLEESGIEVVCFDSPAECLAQLRTTRCGLLITDLRMPGKNGIEVLSEVRQSFPWLPVLMITAYGDIPTAVKAIKAGAVDFIEKPLPKETLVRKVKVILERSASAPARLGKPLTRAEAPILRLIMQGMSNKEIATLTNRSIRTIETHRAHIMQKFGVDNIIDFLKLGAAMRLIDLEPEPPDKEEEEEEENEDDEQEGVADGEEEP